MQQKFWVKRFFLIFSKNIHSLFTFINVVKTLKGQGNKNAADRAF